MQRRWPVAVLAVGGAVLLASLYLPWLEPSVSKNTLDLFLVRNVDGWNTYSGDAAAVADLLVIALALAAFRPSLTRRLPLSEAALLAFYLTVVVGAEARTTADVDEAAGSGAHYHYAYGAYLGVAAGVAVVLACVARWGAPPAPDRSLVPRGASSLLLGTLLVAFVLPWFRFSLAARGIAYQGTVTPAGVVAASLAVWLLVGMWSSRTTPTARLALAATTALFTGAAFSPASTVGVSYMYGAWMGLASGVALLVVMVATEARSVRLRRARGRDFLIAAAATLLVASFFLPWQAYDFPNESRPGVPRAASANGWTLLGTAAAVFAVLLVISALSHGRGRRRIFESVSAIAVLITAAGFELPLVGVPGLELEISYGAKIGFAAAALLAVLAPAGARRQRVDRPLVIAPIAVCVAYIVVVTLPWWDVLPAGAQQDLRYAEPSWLTIAGLVVALRLIRAWAAGDRRWLLTLPAVMLALGAIVLFASREEGIEWGGGLVVAFSLLLILLGTIEREGGLESFRVPEILRVDRL